MKIETEIGLLRSVIGILDLSYRDGLRGVEYIVIVIQTHRESDTGQLVRHIDNLNCYRFTNLNWF